jgi:hypothetical protein
VRVELANIATSGFIIAVVIGNCKVAILLCRNEKSWRQRAISDCIYSTERHLVISSERKVADVM